MLTHGVAQEHSHQGDVDRDGKRDRRETLKQRRTPMLFPTTFDAFRFVLVLRRFERRTITFLSRLGFFEDCPTSLIDSVGSKQKGYMARLGRFELPTSGSGDQRSIHLSYRRAVQKFRICSNNHSRNS